MKERFKKILEATLSIIMKPFLDAKLKKEKILAEIEYKKASKMARGLTAKNYILSRLKDAQSIRAARRKREEKALRRKKEMGLKSRSIGILFDADVLPNLDYVQEKGFLFSEVNEKGGMGVKRTKYIIPNCVL